MNDGRDRWETSDEPKAVGVIVGGDPVASLPLMLHCGRRPAFAACGGCITYIIGAVALTTERPEVSLSLTSQQVRTNNRSTGVMTGNEYTSMAMQSLKRNSQYINCGFSPILSSYSYKRRSPEPPENESLKWKLFQRVFKDYLSFRIHKKVKGQIQITRSRTALFKTTTTRPILKPAVPKSQSVVHIHQCLPSTI